MKHWRALLIVIAVICFGIALSYPIRYRMAQESNNSELEELSAMRQRAQEALTAQDTDVQSQSKPDPANGQEAAAGLEDTAASGHALDNPTDDEQSAGSDGDSRVETPGSAPEPQAWTPDEAAQPQPGEGGEAVPATDAPTMPSNEGAQQAPAEPAPAGNAAEPAAQEQPEAPAEPAAQEQPEAPAEPAAQEQPEAPAEPAAQEQPQAPAEPAAQEQPEAPAEPAAQTQTEPQPGGEVAQPESQTGDEAPDETPGVPVRETIPPETPDETPGVPVRETIPPEAPEEIPEAPEPAPEPAQPPDEAHETPEPAAPEPAQPPDEAHETPEPAQPPDEAHETPEPAAPEPAQPPDEAHETPEPAAPEPAQPSDEAHETPEPAQPPDEAHETPEPTPEPAQPPDSGPTKPPSELGELIAALRVTPVPTPTPSPRPGLDVLILELPDTPAPNLEPTPEPTPTPVPTPTPDRRIRVGALSYPEKQKILFDEEKILPELRPIYALNSDLIGWLVIPDTVIDYPVVQTEDSEYYLDHDFYGNENINGQLILDPLNDPYTPSYNLIISGHHMKNGSMFGNLPQYSSKSYWQKHKFVEFDSLMERKQYVVFACFYSADYDEDEKGFRYNADIQYRLDMDLWMEQVRKSQLYDTGIDVQFGDEIITLTTCDRARHRNGRFVVVCRKVREGETFE